MPTTYDEPVEAELYVHLKTGRKWKATPEDLVKFDLDNRHETYWRFDRRLIQILAAAGLIERDVTEAHINPLRYLAEMATCMPNLLDHPEMAENDAAIVAIERTLRRSVNMDDQTADVIRALLAKVPADEETDRLMQHVPEILRPTS